MYKLISVTRWGEPVNMDNYTIRFVGKDYIIVQFKGYGFTACLSAANCYTVITEKV